VFCLNYDGRWHRCDLTQREHIRGNGLRRYQRDMTASGQRVGFTLREELINDCPAALIVRLVLGRKVLEVERLSASSILKSLQIIIVIHMYTHDLQYNNVPTTIELMWLYTILGCF
jgi:hypothetical protein